MKLQGKKAKFLIDGIIYNALSWELDTEPDRKASEWLLERFYAQYCVFAHRYFIHGKSGLMPRN